jgi:hypothetical protein
MAPVHCHCVTTEKLCKYTCKCKCKASVLLKYGLNCPFRGCSLFLARTYAIHSKAQIPAAGSCDGLKVPKMHMACCSAAVPPAVMYPLHICQPMSSTIRLVHLLSPPLCGPHASHVCHAQPIAQPVKV